MKYDWNSTEGPDPREAMQWWLDVGKKQDLPFLYGYYIRSTACFFLRYERTSPSMLALAKACLEP